MAKHRSSEAYKRFAQVILRSHNLISLFEFLDERFGADPDLDFSDLLRSAVVLSVAAMDAYFTDVFAEKLVPFLKRKGSNRKLVALLEKAGLDASVALELLPMKRPYRRIRSLIDAHLERHVTQRLGVIDRLFGAYGVQNLSKRAEARLLRHRLCREIEVLVSRRHSIAHDGDLNRHGRLVPLEIKWVRNRLKDVQKFVGACDEILRGELG